MDAIRRNSDGKFEERRGTSAAEALVPTIEQGLTPVAIGRQHPIAIDLSKAASRQTSERVIGAFLWTCGALSLLTTVGIILVLVQQAFVFFSQVPISDFLFGTTWTALFKTPLYGALPLVGGTLLITLIAMCVSVPLGLMSAIFLSEYAAPRARNILKPALELLAGIPTIVYGFFAVTFIRPADPEADLRGNWPIQRARRRDRGRHHDDTAGCLVERGRDARGTPVAA